MMMNYKKTIITKFGGTQVIKTMEEDGLPEPKANEVRVKVLHSCVNFTDIMIRKGKYPDVKEKPPFSPGYDMVGIIDKVGANVKGLKTGQKVADMTVIGAHAQYICLPEDQPVPLPEEIDPKEAVCLVLSYLTAYQMLHRTAKIDTGQKILIHGAGGAVGNALLQLGKLQGLEMYGTASESKHELINENNATPIDYRHTDFVKKIKSGTGHGVDAVFDPIGGQNFKKSFSVLKKGGKLVAYGFYDAVMGKGGSIPLDFIRLVTWNILPNGKSTVFYSIGAMRKKHPEWFKEDLITLFRLLAEKKIKPVIAEQIHLDDIAKAHEKIENAEVNGKIIVNVQ